MICDELCLLHGSLHLRLITFHFYTQSSYILHMYTPETWVFTLKWIIKYFCHNEKMFTLKIRQKGKCWKTIDISFCNGKKGIMRPVSHCHHGDKIFHSHRLMEESFILAHGVCCLASKQKLHSRRALWSKGAHTVAARKPEERLKRSQGQQSTLPAQVLSSKSTFSYRTPQ